MIVNSEKFQALALNKQRNEELYKSRIDKQNITNASSIKLIV